MDKKKKKTVVIGILGPTLDSGFKANRWEKWRPTVSLCQNEDLIVDRLELLFQNRFADIAKTVTQDIRSISPETEVCLKNIEWEDPWNLEQVYGALYQFSRTYPFKTEAEDYLIHITTGTHIAQICMFLLTESRYFPARLIQTSPPTRRNDKTSSPRAEIIDLDLSRYDRIATRFKQEATEAVSFLKSGIETKNKLFNQLIERIEKVAIRSIDPLLLMGPTGAGKSQLAKKIYELKKARHSLSGPFVEVNCATIQGDGAMSTLFGHTKGSFTGAVTERPGLLRTANKGMLFLDEIGELGLDEQGMLLRAIEEKAFLPVGSDREVRTEFQLIAGTNRDLSEEVTRGKFREDLLARINLWAFQLPGLKERLEDIEPNLDFELEKYSAKRGERITINREARDIFLRFSTSPEAKWQANFRDLNAAVTRMATLANKGRISELEVTEETQRLRSSWVRTSHKAENQLLTLLLGEEKTLGLDLFDRIQLEGVLQVCQSSSSLSEAGRVLFAASQAQKSSANDADRLRKYLARFGLNWLNIRST